MIPARHRPQRPRCRRMQPRRITSQRRHPRRLITPGIRPAARPRRQHPVQPQLQIRRRHRLRMQLHLHPSHHRPRWKRRHIKYQQAPPPRPAPLIRPPRHQKLPSPVRHQPGRILIKHRIPHRLQLHRRRSHHSPTQPNHHPNHHHPARNPDAAPPPSPSRPILRQYVLFTGMVLGVTPEN